MDKKLNALHDSLRVSQGELISTMELLWKQNKKAVNEVTDTFNDSLYSVNRDIKKIGTKTTDLGSDLELYISQLKESVDDINKAIAVINGNIAGLERNINGVSTKLETLSTQVSKIKK